MDTFMVAAETYQATKTISKLNNIVSIPLGSTDYSTHINLSPLSFRKH